MKFLDELRELLWSTYGEEITRQEYTDLEQPKLHEEQLAVDFDDQILF